MDWPGSNSWPGTPPCFSTCPKRVKRVATPTSNIASRIFRSSPSVRDRRAGSLSALGFGGEAADPAGGVGTGFCWRGTGAPGVAQLAQQRALRGGGPGAADRHQLRQRLLRRHSRRRRGPRGTLSACRFQIGPALDGTFGGLRLVPDRRLRGPVVGLAHVVVAFTGGVHRHPRGLVLYRRTEALRLLRLRRAFCDDLLRFRGDRRHQLRAAPLDSGLVVVVWSRYRGHGLRPVGGQQPS